MNDCLHGAKHILKLSVSVAEPKAYFLLSLCGPVIDWWPVQGVSCLLPNDNWERLQPPHYPKLDSAGIENGWTDAFRYPIF